MNLLKDHARLICVIEKDNLHGNVENPKTIDENTMVDIIFF